MEKSNQPLKNTDSERQSYIDAIARLLQKADLEDLRLIWIAAKNLVK